MSDDSDPDIGGYSQQLSYPSSSSSTPAPKNKTRGIKRKVTSKKAAVVGLSDDQKILLCSLVKDKPVIWSLQHHLHRRPDAQNAAWKVISTIVEVNGN